MLTDLLMDSHYRQTLAIKGGRTNIPSTLNNSEKIKTI